MRLWSLHPRYLDRQGLTAAWREALLAQSVLTKGSGGYANHPQLERFRCRPEPLAAMGAFLVGIADEADERGYRFDRTRIRRPSAPASRAVAVGATTPMIVTSGQLALEWRHLMVKLERRSPAVHARLADAGHPEPHPLFVEEPGPVASWERHSPGDAGQDRRSREARNG